MNKQRINDLLRQIEDPRLRWELRNAIQDEIYRREVLADSVDLEQRYHRALAEVKALRTENARLRFANMPTVRESLTAFIRDTERIEIRMLDLVTLMDSTENTMRVYLGELAHAGLITHSIIGGVVRAQWIADKDVAA